MSDPHLEVSVDEAWPELPGGAEVEETKLAGLGVVEEVCPVRVCLHVSVEEELPEDELEDVPGDVIPGLLVQLCTLVDGKAGEELCGQHLGGAVGGVHPGEGGLTWILRIWSSLRYIIFRINSSLK